MGRGKEADKQRRQVSEGCCEEQYPERRKKEQKFKPKFLQIQKEAKMVIGSSGRKTFDEINITPLTDVFLVLLIIMILIAPLINQSSLKVEPPVAQHGTSEQQNKLITVEVSKEGVIAVNGIKVSDERTPIERIQGLVRDAMKSEFQKIGTKDAPVAVRADQEARQKYVVSVLDAAAGIGVKKLRIVTLQNAAD